ncbi:hypothetical protein [Bradyrhizobium sp. 2TAF24]|uniref:hypothetical protein n=1 Tax=Bradyrhizobium sp. 2TAF24 TaxID=3233011 RepID=UPI003F929BDD
MLRRALSASAVRRGSKAAVALIGPLVDSSRSRLNGIPDIAWLDPYLVGFMVMLITIVAKREVARLQDEALCSVQSQAWSEITGLRTELIGEEALLLSSARHQQFELGRQRALALGLHLYGGAAHAVLQNDAWPGGIVPFPAQMLDSGESVSTAEQIDRRDAMLALWSDTFDAYIAQLPLAMPRQ